jgi:hypothetical protein
MILVVFFWICFLLAAVLAILSNKEGGPAWVNPASYIFALIALAIAGYKVFGFG